TRQPAPCAPLPRPPAQRAQSIRVDSGHARARLARPSVLVVGPLMPAFLVHGVPDTHRLWAPLRARLRRTDVITPSLPGFGCPLPAGFAASKEAYVDWLVREIERVGAPVDLVGHDWGALPVQRLVSPPP